MNLRSLAALVPALAALVSAAPAAAGSPSGVTSEAVSANWAGYEAATHTSRGFSAASGSWIQPAVNCSAGQSYSAYWVGLGGGASSSTALEQQGTQADCSAGGRASYYAWYELVPSAQVRINLPVHAGDRIWARTSVSGSQVTVQVDNKTTGKNFSRTLTMTGPGPDTSTAEWVAEAPSACQGGATGNCQPLPLANFRSVRFTNAYATSAGRTRSVSGWNTQAIALSPAAASGGLNGYGGGSPGGPYDPYASALLSSGAGAAPGSLSPDGTRFAVRYGAGLSSAPAQGGAGSSDGGYGYGAYGNGLSAYGSGAGYGGYGGYGSGAGYGGYGSGAGYSGYGAGSGSTVVAVDPASLLALLSGQLGN